MLSSDLPFYNLKGNVHFFSLFLNTTCIHHQSIIFLFVCFDVKVKCQDLIIIINDLYLLHCNCSVTFIIKLNQMIDIGFN